MKIIISEGETEFLDDLGGYDSGLWLELFVRADKIDPEIAQRLMYLRNTGCRLQEDVKFGYSIIPIEDYWDQAGVSYAEERKCLFIYKHEVIKLLRGLGR